MIRILLFFSLAFLCWGLFDGAALAANSMGYLLPERTDFSLGLGIDYETGDYGGDSTSDFISVPFYFDGYPTDRLDFELIIPYVYLRMEEDGVSTVFYRTPGGYTSGSGRGRNSTTAVSDSSTVTSETVTTKQHSSESGLGDISLTAGYIWVAEGSTMPQVRSTFYLKFPTADEDKGLGTGEFDYGPGLTLNKWNGDWHLFAEGLYVVQGDSDLYDTQNYFTYNAGVGYQFSVRFYGALQARGATAPADGGDDALDGRLKGVWRIASDVSLEGYAGTGFSDGSADFSSSIAVFFDF